MKKIIALIIAALLVAVMAYAGLNMKVTGQTANATIVSGAGFLNKIIVQTDGTNAVNITAYDNTAASGTVLFSTYLVLSSATNRQHIITFEGQTCPFHKGIYIVAQTAGDVVYDVYFEKR